MFRDDLSIPLARQSLFQRLWAKRPSALAVAYGLSITGFVAAGVWAYRTPMPFAGEPVVVAAIPAPEEIITASIEPPLPPAAAAATADEPLDEELEPNASEEVAADHVPDVPMVEEPVEQVGPKKRGIIRIDEAPSRQDTYKQATGNVIISPRRPLATAPDKSISESTADGVLPKIGNGGRSALNVYARPAPMSIIHSDTPKIAIVLGGMGISSKLTQRAIDELPADVTLAFAPYGQNLQDQVNAARSEGHEVFLQVPLEPVGFPATNPGPKTLLSEQGEKENSESLHWHMSRFAGYAGVINYMGGRFLTDEKAAKPFLKELKARGLLFVDDGTAPLSTSTSIASQIKLKAKRSHLVIDASPNASDIADALRKLEEEAEQNGTAIGTGSGLAVTIDTVKDWIKDASERGIVIIPVSAAFKGRVG